MLCLILPFFSKILLICTSIFVLIYIITYFLNFRNKEKRYIHKGYLIVAGLLAISFLIFAFFAPYFIFINPAKDLFLSANEDSAATIYNLMSPFIAIAAAILTFMAFWVQHSANNEMLKNNEKQNVEKQFYEMLQIHKQNVKELQWENWTIQSSIADNILNINTIFPSNNQYSYHQISGYRIFELHLIEYFFIEESLLKAINILQRNENITINYKSVESWKKIISFSYDIYMQGISSFKKNYNKQSSKNFFDTINDKDKITKIKENIDQKNPLNTFTTLPISIKKPIFQEDKNNLLPLYLYFLLSYFKFNMQPYDINLTYSQNYKLLRGANLFSGHYDELNRYYRHLYQTVKIVANYDSKIISYDEKRKFLRMLRAQLTSDEQLLLFYNWVSGPMYGEDWEKQNENHFFTEYRMIHNLNPENSNIFIELGYDNIIMWIKSFNPDYNDYDNHPLFEFENR